MNQISVIIPVKEEMKLQFHHKIINSYKGYDNFDLIWVIGPSSDGTYEDLIAKNQVVIKTKYNSRAARLNEGIRKSKNELLLFNHPRSFLSKDSLDAISRLDVSGCEVWGGFTHEFLGVQHPLLKFTSYYSNKIRFDINGIVYLDHCIYLTKNLIDIKDSTPVPEEDLFEDTLLSKKLLKRMRPLRIRQKSYTSPVRFQINGVYKQSYLNQKLKWKYYFGFPLDKLNQDYEKNLNLNSKY